MTNPSKLINNKVEYVLIAGGSSAEADVNNRVLLKNELGIETDTFKMKLGDGVRRYKDLPYIPFSLLSQAIVIQIINIFNNGAVLSFNGRTGVIVLTLNDITDALGYTPVDNIVGIDGSGFNITVAGTTTVPTIAITTTLTQNSIAFIGASGALSENNTQLSWDNSAQLLTVGDTGDTYLQVDTLGKTIYIASGSGVTYIGSLFTGTGNALITVDDTNQLITLATVATQITNLSGVGTRMVTVNASGILSTAAIPSGTGTVTNFIFTDGSGFDGTVTFGTTTPTVALTTTLTTGSVVFIGASGALNQDNANLFFDNANDRLGIGTNSPTTLLQLGTSGTKMGVISLAGSTSGLITLTPKAIAGTWTFTLPDSVGTNGYVLTTNGSGVSTWTDPATLVSNIYNANGTLTGNRVVNGGTNSLTFRNLSTFDIGYANTDVVDIKFRSTNNTTIVAQGVFTATATNLTVWGTSLLTLAGSGIIIHDGISSSPYTIPNAAGSVGNVLTMTGVSTASWSAPTTGVPSLLQYRVPFGDVSNLMTSSGDFTYDSDTNFAFSVAFTSATNNTALILDSLNSLFSINRDGNLYLNLDIANGLYELGDINNTLNGSNILIDDTNRVITFTSSDIILDSSISTAIPYLGNAIATRIVTVDATGILNAIDLPLIGANGGTGVANTGKTLTITGVASNWTVSSPADSTYTFPTTSSALLANNLGLSGNTVLIGGTGSAGTLILQSTSNATRGKIFLGNNGTDSAYDEANVRLGIGIESPLYAFEVTKTITGTDFGIYAHITTANNAGNKTGLRIDLLPGYTGTGQADALVFSNTVIGTGAGGHLNGSYSGNHGCFGATTGSTATGTNVGLMAYARFALLNIGMFGTADDVKAGASVANIGVAGMAVPPGTGVYAGGVFVAQPASGFNTVTIASCALLADNTGQAVPIALFRDNGTVVIQFADGGNAFFGGTTSPTAKVHIGAGTATASTSPLKLTSSGTGLTGLLTAAEAGSIEYTTYGLWLTTTTPTRHKVWHGLIGATAPATNLIGVIIDYYGSSATRVLTTPNTWVTIIGDDGNTYKIPAYS